jgi:EmrB/QacA subfamily drug resistance transporter
MNQLRRDGSDLPTTAPPVEDRHAAAFPIVIGIMLAMFLSALEQTIVAPALPSIGRALGDVEDLPWVITAYLLTTTAATPLFGKLSDIHGRRLMMLISIGVFVVGSAACALAPNIGTLVLARALQGLGGGGILPLAQTIIADLLAPRERPIVMAYTSVMFMTASILGPVLGGVLTDYVHWSLIFWINLPLGLLAFAMSERVLRRLPRNDRPHRLDVIGGALMVAAALGLLLALNWGGTRYPWNSPEILALFGGSLVLWAAFGARLAHAPEPFIPLTMLNEPTVLGVIVAAFFSIGTIVGIAIFVPLYVELLLGSSASASGFVLIAFMGGATLGSMAAGRLLARFEHYKRVPIVALPFGIAGLGTLAISPGSLSIPEVAALLALAGAGMGPMYPATTVIIQNCVPPHQFGIATGSLNFFRSLGGAIIVAVFSAIVIGGLDRAGTGSALDDILRSGVPPAQLAILFRFVFSAAAVFVAVSLVAIAAIEERPLGGARPK